MYLDFFDVFSPFLRVFFCRKIQTAGLWILRWHREQRPELHQRGPHRLGASAVLSVGTHWDPINGMMWLFFMGWKTCLFWSLWILSGWWFGCHLDYFPRNIGNVIIPIDFHIFQRGSNHQPVMCFFLFPSEYTTRNWFISQYLTWLSLWRLGAGYHVMIL